MRLIPRRKLTWLLVLLGVVTVAFVSIWMAASAKSDFEKRYDQIKVEMTIPEAFALMQMDLGAMATLSLGGGPSPYMQFGWANDGERIALAFENGRLTEKEFIPLTGTEKLRRLWAHTFESRPPF